MATTGFIKNFVVKNGITTGPITLDAGTGNITGTNLSVTGNSDLGAIANVHITGGSTGQAIITDGSGNLTFGNVSVEADPAPMPTYVAVGNTITISSNYQGIFGYPITVDGTIVVDGILVDVNDATVPAGNINYVQYNAGNVMGGDANFYYTAINGTMTLQNETIIGNSTIGNLVISNTSNLGSVSNVRITGGSSGQYLQTDGAGNLSWAAGGGGGSGSPGGVNTQVQFNDAGTFAGNTGFTFNKTTGTLVATIFSGAGNALSNIQGANVTGAVSYATTANSVAVANVSGIGNIATTNYNGNGSQVLAGNGAWINSSGGGGTSAAAAVGYSLIFGG